jgi:hypothetical protein
MKPTLKLAKQIARGARTPRELVQALEIAREAAHEDARRTLIRRRADSAQVGVLRGDISIFEGRIVEPCPVPQCDRPAHTGLHEDEAGFRWRQDEQAERAWKP